MSVVQCNLDLKIFIRTQNKNIYVLCDPINSNLLALSLPKTLTLPLILSSPSGFITWVVITILLDRFQFLLFMWPSEVVHSTEVLNPLEIMAKGKEICVTITCHFIRENIKGNGPLEFRTILCSEQQNKEENYFRLKSRIPVCAATCSIECTSAKCIFWLQIKQIFVFRLFVT